MRFDTPIYFQCIKPGKYNTSTGNYGDDVISEEMRYASVTDTGAETMNLLYGEIKQGCLTARLQNHYNKPFDRVKIGNKVYRVDKNRKLRVMHTLVLSEVP